MIMNSPDWRFMHFPTLLCKNCILSPYRNWLREVHCPIPKSHKSDISWVVQWSSIFGSGCSLLAWQYSESITQPRVETTWEYSCVWGLGGASRLTFSQHWIAKSSGRKQCGQEHITPLLPVNLLKPVLLKFPSHKRPYQPVNFRCILLLLLPDTTRSLHHQHLPLNKKIT